ncbi:MAG: thioredoxin family protein [Halofilum sp. (in: g-proteobacteria)]|nr:thioredoxin family protein [Halofilum sp. (in: g-proteobacteria)]
MKIEVLGTGCKKCVNTAEQISEAAQSIAVDAQVEKVTDPAVMMRYGVMSTPAVVIDGKLVHSGSVPDRETIENWLRN